MVNLMGLCDMKVLTLKVTQVTLNEYIIRRKREVFMHVKRVYLPLSGYEYSDLICMPAFHGNQI